MSDISDYYKKTKKNIKNSSFLFWKFGNFALIFAPAS